MFSGNRRVTINKAFKVLQLKKRGVAIRNTYQNTKWGGVFIDYITESLGSKLKSDLKKCNFFNVLREWSTWLAF